MIVNNMGILPRRFHALLGYHVGGGTKSPRTVHLGGWHLLCERICFYEVQVALQQLVRAIERQC